MKDIGSRINESFIVFWAKFGPKLELAKQCGICVK